MKKNLVSKYFHIYENGKIEKQGRVEEKLSDTKYRVSLCNWVDGAPTGSEVVDVDQMGSWKFYDNVELWRSIADRDVKF